MKTLAAAAFAALLSLVPAARAAETGEGGIADVDFSFEGPFGTYDTFQLQRGLQIYTEVCAACHGLKYVPFRSLHDEGGVALPEDQVRAFAAAFPLLDEDSNRRLYDVSKAAFRVMLPSDPFPANNTQGAPDLSLMAKARAGFHGPYGTGISQLFNGMGGPEYLVAILTGYTGKEKTEFGVTLYENTAFPGGWIRMGPPLADGAVTYAPEHASDLHQLSEDVAAFLMWAAEPKMMARKYAGFVGVALLLILTGLLYATNRRLWAPHKGKA